MAIVLALLSAIAYGTSDFAAGLASRRLGAGPVTGVAQALGLLTAALAVLLFPGHGPDRAALVWGAISGLGSTLGTLSLYKGLAVARMTVVATISAVLTAVLPAVVGVALGDRLPTLTATGTIIAIPAIAFVSWHPGGDRSDGAHAGLLYGALAGLGFALLFVALDRAGTRAGAWPLVPGQLVSLVLIAPVALRGFAGLGDRPRSAATMTLAAGVLSGVANLLFLAATGHGQLAVVAVLTALYPAVTVLLARTLLAERWTRPQVAGMLVAAVAIVLVTIG